MSKLKTGKASPKDATQSVPALNQRPQYLVNVENLTAVDIPITTVASQERNVILHNFTLSRGKVTAIFQLPDYETETNWYRFKEGRSFQVILPNGKKVGVQKTVDLQIEFLKFAYSIALENLEHDLPRWEKSRNTLLERGYDDSYFQTTYTSDPHLNKLFYILRDNNLLDEFKKHKYDFKRFEGTTMKVAWSERGNLMSTGGDENRTTKASVPASDTVVSVADYERTREDLNV